MKNRLCIPIVWMIAVFFFSLSVSACAFASGEGDISYAASLCVYAISNESRLRDAGDTADIALLGED